MFVRWKKRVLASGPTSYRAQVVSSHRSGGKVRQQIVSHLGSVRSDSSADDISLFWGRAFEILDGLGLSSEQRSLMLDRLSLWAGPPPLPVTRKLHFWKSRPIAGFSSVVVSLRSYRGSAIIDSTELATGSEWASGEMRYKHAILFWCRLIDALRVVATPEERRRWLSQVDSRYPHPGSPPSRSSSHWLLVDAPIYASTFGLELSQVTLPVLKKRYRSLASMFHPDVGGSAIEFRHIQACHDYLKLSVDMASRF